MGNTFTIKHRPDAQLTITVRDRVTFDLKRNGLPIGLPGLSTYDIWLLAGNSGTYIDFLESQRGNQGEPGIGVAQYSYNPETNALTIWFTDGGSLTIHDFRGINGQDGVSIEYASYNPATGIVTFHFSDQTLYATGDLRGAAGKSAYQVAVNNGFDGTEQQWLASLIANAGDYEIGNQVLIFENQLV